MPKQQYIYEYPRPMVTVDAIIVSRHDGEWQVLLIERKHDPWAGFWALPGGFLEMDESLEAGVARELEEETGLRGIKLEQFRTFGDLDRDPRGRVITVAYVGIVDWGAYEPCAADDAADAAWFPAHNLPKLASDHQKIIECAIMYVDKGHLA